MGGRGGWVGGVRVGSVRQQVRDARVRPPPHTSARRYRCICTNKRTGEEVHIVGNFLSINCGLLNEQARARGAAGSYLVSGPDVVIGIVLCACDGGCGGKLSCVYVCVGG